jgi:UDPglucose--hexose-1-phosphate uridylyltransferase
LEVSHLRIEYDAFRRAPGTLKYLAGSEVGGGAFMNDVAPEDAAGRLREAIRST